MADGLAFFIGVRTTGASSVLAVLLPVAPSLLQYISITSFVPQGHTYDVPEASHLEGFQSFDVVLGYWPGLRTIEED